MMENHKDSKAMSLFEEFCDVDTLQNRIELIDDVKDRLLMELGDSESEEERERPQRGREDAVQAAR